MKQTDLLSKRTLMLMITIITLIMANLIVPSCEKPERIVKIVSVDILDTDISYTSVTLKGEIVDLGSRKIEDHGIILSENSMPRVGNARVESLGPISSKGVFQVSVSNLTKNTLYYFRAFVTIDGIDIYTDKVNQFKTKDTQLASVSSFSIIDTTLTTSRAIATVTSDGGETVSKRGFCWGTSTNPQIGNCLDTTINGSGTGSFNGLIHGLAAGTRYYVRAYAINNKGISYNSADVILTTYDIPALTTIPLSSQTTTGAVSGGSITNPGGTAVTVRGVCWGTLPAPTISLSTKTADGPGTGVFSSTIAGLTPGTLYYIRSYATNKFGTGYGNEIQFTPAMPASAVTLAATMIGNTTVSLNGTVNANNFDATVTFEYGTSTAYGTSVSATAGTVTGKLVTGVLANVSGLTSGTLYHFRVKSVNAGGTAPGEDLTFTTLQAPDATTDAASSVLTTSATLNGTVNANNSSTTVTFEYGPTTSYSSSITATQSPVTGSAPTAVSVSLTGLTSGATYHYRVKALSAGGTTYGGDRIIGTQSPPVSVTNPATFVTTIGATLNGTVNANSLSSTITFEYGTTTAYGSTATATQSPVSGSSATDVSASPTGLTPGTTYHFRVLATSTAGTTPGSDLIFTTLQPPTVTSLAATLLGNTTVTLNGSVNSNNSSSTITFEYGTTTAYGTTVTATQSPVTGNTITSVSADLTGLTPGTTYHFKVLAVSEGGNAEGSDLTFITSQPPTATTGTTGSITTTTAVLNGTVNANNLSSNVTFEYGTTTAYGSIAAATPGAVTGNTTTAVSASMTGLTPSTTYHFRVKAMSSGGTSLGLDGSFTTSAAPTVADIDGNVYNIVTIGTQVWMAENLKTTKYKNGDLIPNVTDNTTWAGLTTGAISFYNNDAATYKNTYGALYNYYATVDNRNLCPTGWHVPTDAEWVTLTTYLGGESVAGGKLKEIGTTHWTAPNTGATNEKGFTALPGGFRAYTGTFSSISISGVYWSLTEYSTIYAWFRNMDYSLTIVQKGNGINDGEKRSGFSVRCLQGEGQVLPAVTTTAASSITSITATSGGIITSDGGATVTARGVCWNTSSDPTTANSKTTVGSGTGAYSSNITGLSPSTTYYARAYATNSVGTVYGNEISFITASVPATITDFDGNVYNIVTIGTQDWMQSNLKTTKYRDGSAIQNVTDNSTWLNTVSGSYCWYNNDQATYKNVYGAIYNYHATVENRNLCPAGWHVPTASDWTTLTDYLTNNGYGYGGSGNDIAKSMATVSGWTTDPSPGVVGNDQGSNNTSGFTAPPSGYRDHITATFYAIGYYGHWWSSSESSATSAAGWHLSYNGLVINNSGFSKQYGNSVRCIKGEGMVLPAVTTTATSSITSITATSGGNIASDGSATVTVRGVCWNTSTGPTIANNKTTDGSGIGAYTSNITGLSPTTTYYVRAYATNSVGTVYGNEISFITSAAPATATDYDGNVYNVVTIGTQDWMKENLKVTHFVNGDAIPNITDNTAWGNQNVSAYCWYNNDEATYKPIYGAMYNYHTTIDTRNLCPLGWHMPSDSEWTTLTNYLGGEGVAGAKLKETGVTHWASPNTSSTNETGFTALPGGYRYLDAFNDIGSSGWFWSTTEYFPPSLFAWYRYMNSTTSNIRSYEYKQVGFSVRCIKGAMPLSETAAATAVASTKATLNGKVNSNGVSTNVTFEYGLTTAYGTEVAATQSPVSGSVPVNVSIGLTGLTPQTTYHYRVKAVNSGGTSYGNDMTFLTPLVSIGDAYAGGIAFYIDGTGLHGLVCAGSDQSTGSEWGCLGTTISGADGTIVGTGLQNTLDIMNDCATTGIAARLCRTLNLNGFTDWYLPSKDELGLMYDNLRLGGFGGFANTYYWSSTEWMGQANLAWMENFSNGSRDGANKNTSYRVRAIRAF